MRVWVSRSEAKNIRRFAMREGDEELADRPYRAEPEGRRQAPFLWRWQRGFVQRVPTTRFRSFRSRRSSVCPTARFEPTPRRSLKRMGHGRAGDHSGSMPQRSKCRCGSARMTAVFEIAGDIASLNRVTDRERLPRIVGLSEPFG